MEQIAIYVLLGSIQAVSVVLIWYLRREETKAKAAMLNANATQVNANSFDTLTKTITTMATDFSSTLMKTIELVNSREKRIDELEAELLRAKGDLKELREQNQDSTNANVQRDNKIELLQKSLDTVTTANAKQAWEITELKAEVLTLQREGEKKDSALIERDKLIATRDDRIKQLEARVKHLEAEIEQLKKPAPVIETKPTEILVVVEKPPEPNPEA